MTFINSSFCKKILGISGISTSIYIIYNNRKIFEKNTDKYFTYSDISKHNNKKKGIWVTYKDNVYNITDFIDNHPGGKDKIMLARPMMLYKFK